MERTVLTITPVNFGTILVMVAAIGALYVVGGQLAQRFWGGGGSANNSGGY